MGDSLTRDIIAAYLTGYDIINLSSKRILAEQKKLFGRYVINSWGLRSLKRLQKM